MRTVSTPYPRRRRSGAPHSGKRASLGSVFELLPPPSFNDGPSCVRRVFLRGASVAPGAAPAGPSRAGPARNHLGSSGAAAAPGDRCRPGVGAGTGAAWTPPPTGLAAPAAAPVPCSAPGPTGLPWPPPPQRVPTAPKPSPASPGQAPGPGSRGRHGKSGVKPT